MRLLLLSESFDFVERLRDKFRVEVTPGLTLSKNVRLDVTQKLNEQRNRLRNYDALLIDNAYPTRPGEALIISTISNQIPTVWMIDDPAQASFESVATEQACFCMSQGLPDLAEAIEKGRARANGAKVIATATEMSRAFDRSQVAVMELMSRLTTPVQLVGHFIDQTSRLCTTRNRQVTESIKNARSRCFEIESTVKTLQDAFKQADGKLGYLQRPVRLGKIVECCEGMLRSRFDCDRTPYQIQMDSDAIVFVEMDALKSWVQLLLSEIIRGGKPVAELVIRTEFSSSEVAVSFQMILEKQATESGSRPTNGDKTATEQMAASKLSEKGASAAGAVERSQDGGELVSRKFLETLNFVTEAGLVSTSGKSCENGYQVTFQLPAFDEIHLAQKFIQWTNRRLEEEHPVSLFSVQVYQPQDRRTVDLLPHVRKLFGPGSLVLPIAPSQFLAMTPLEVDEITDFADYAMETWKRWNLDSLNGSLRVAAVDTWRPTEFDEFAQALTTIVEKMRRGNEQKPIVVIADNQPDVVSGICESFEAVGCQVTKIDDENSECDETILNESPLVLDLRDCDSNPFDVVNDLIDDHQFLKRQVYMLSINLKQQQRAIDATALQRPGRLEELYSLSATGSSGS